MSGRGGSGWLGQLVGACLSLMVAAIAFSVAVTILRPYFTALALIGGALVLLAAWRAWQRSRW